MDVDVALGLSEASLQPRFSRISAKKQFSH